jgi:predicted alpha/beta superfamily hydrolase
MTSQASRTVILGTRTHNVSSTVTGNDYELAVWLPPSYGTTDDRYPVLYLLDSPYAFGLAWASVCFRIWEELMPETIVVGVGAPVQTLDDWNILRVRDYTPRPIAGLEASGHGDAFLGVLSDDLIPFVDSTFRSDPASRTLWGHSFGGAFALHALLNRPGLFQRYIATSPAVVFNGVAVIDLDDDAPAGGTQIAAHLFISVGALDEEYRAGILAFTEALRRQNYGGLHIDLAELPDCAHASAAPAGFLAGLQATFPSRHL